MKRPRGGEIARLERAARAAGGLATHVTRVALYGTRRTPDTDAGTAPAQRAGVGIGKHSVWDGPRQIKGGAPILKRFNPA